MKAAAIAVDINWEVRVRDRNTCQYCGLDGSDNFKDWMNTTLDHIVPNDKDGPWELDNLVVACFECNCIKRAYMPAGLTREEQFLDAKKYVLEQREKKREEWHQQATAIVRADTHNP